MTRHKNEKQRKKQRKKEKETGIKAPQLSKCRLYIRRLYVGLK